MATQQVLAPIALKKILVLTDFSPTAESALTFAATTAAVFSAQVTLLHVLHHHRPESMQADMAGFATDEEHREAERKLLRESNKPELSGVVRDVLLKRGDFWTAVAETVQTAKIDLIVVGTHARGGLHKLLLGSAAEEVLRQAACPVMAIGPAAAKRGTIAFKRILFATDFLAGSVAALPYATSFVERNDGELVAVHIVDLQEITYGPEVVEQMVAPAKEKLASMLAACPLTRAPEIVAELGSRGDGIVTVAARKNADLIVMGARTPSRVPAATHLPWTVAHHVIAHAPCPVLTVRG